MQLKNLKTKTFLALLFLCSQNYANELGENIALKGTTNGVVACSICHGINGEGRAKIGFPKLAGLNAIYLKKQLNDFTTSARKNAQMSPISNALSQEEIAAVAEYYADIPAPDVLISASANKLNTLGKRLAQVGDWSKDIPSCFACHGKNALGISSHFPLLAGQHADYIEKQLNDWKANHRSNDPNNLMKVIAMRMSVDEIKAVSAYLASLPVATKKDRDN
jgi:cytochrome c553